ncbi:MAG: hypothetical protein BKP49_09670 [Treponema sp. CETP13]|nr:MAG: hypothetical protein BKP49_09670 [Treponema sp. CETP13]
MSLYKISIKLLSPISTPLMGDTIWGHVVWGIANHEGDDAVNTFLSGCRTGDDPFVVSSAFPHGYVCKPIPTVKKRKSFLSTIDYAQIKKNKKIRYISASNFFDNISKIKDSDVMFDFENYEQTRNAVNRISGTAENGILFSTSELWAKAENSTYDLYVWTNKSIQRIQNLFTWAFENGYGANSSIGNGNIHVLKTIQEILPKAEKSFTYLALGPFVRSQNGGIPDDGIKTICADTFTRTGKIGGMFAGGVLQPYKKTVVLFNEGAVITATKPLKYVGVLLTDIHSDSRICQSGFAPVIPIDLQEDE